MSSSTKHPTTDPTLLLDRIKEIFPELSWNTYVYNNEGWDHDVIILDNRIVFRFPNDQEYLNQLKTEITVLKHLTPLVDVSIPAYEYVAPDATFAGYAMIPGKVVDKKLFDNLAPEDRTAFARQLAAFVSTLHTLRPEEYGNAPVEPSDMKEQQARLRKQVPQFLRGVLNSQDYASAQVMLDELDELYSSTLPAVFVHGDIYHSHLLWDETNQHLGVIDFSDMNIGDPAIDFAESFEYGVDFIKEMYSYYTGPKDASFLERAWKHEKWVGLFMMVDHFINHKISFEESREIFDRVKQTQIDFS